jgi:recombination protein RecA
MKTDDIKKALRKKRGTSELTAKDFLSTGSTLLNLACSGHPERGFAKGQYYFIVGDSISGKTWLSLTCLAEAVLNPNFAKHRFIYDNGEDGALMNIERFFGKGVANRIESPKQGPSFQIEEFYYSVDDAISDGNPFIYILDSMDSLSSEPEANYFKKTKKARRAGKDENDIKGSYGDGKAKVNSAMLRRIIGRPLRESGSILIIINQTRDNIGALPFQPKKTRSGGHALKFYACFELWSSVAGEIKKTVNGKKRQLGVESKIRVKKNRITGRDRTVTIPIYNSYGIDNVGSCVDYLIEEGHWRKGKEINAKELGIKASRKKLIKLVEQGDLEKDLYDLVGEIWNEIEDACMIRRKKRYV